MNLHCLHAALLGAVTTCLLAPGAALAAAKGEDTPLDLPLDQPRQVDTGGSGGGNLVRTFVGLAIVVAVIYGLYWVLRQVKAGREDRATGSGLRSTASVPLGPNRSLHLVRAGNEHVLVGVAEQGVTPIRSWGEEEARAAGLFDLDRDDDGAGGPPVTGRLKARTIGQALEDIRRRTVRS